MFHIQPHTTESIKQTAKKDITMQQNQEGDQQRQQQQNQDQRLKQAMQTENQQQQQQQPQQQNQQPQKCPRCESLNTKFCYYNNYSLSQPRYFCKTCRRYWTQGGTLRNVPVGGGCRTGKRSKTSSSSSTRSLQPPPQPQPPQHVQDQEIQKNLTVRSVGMSSTSPSSGLASHHQYYPGGTHGYFSSYAAIQSLNQLQSFIVGGHHDPSSNLSLLQGFNLSASFGRSQQQQPPHQLFQMGNTKSNMVVDQQPLYPSDQESLLIPSSTRTQASDHDWPHHQSFINKSASNASAASESALWAMGSSNPTTTSGHINTNTTSAGTSLNPNQWPDLPGSYGSTP